MVAVCVDVELPDGLYAEVALVAFEHGVARPPRGPWGVLLPLL